MPGSVLSLGAHRLQADQDCSSGGRAADEGGQGAPRKGWAGASLRAVGGQ